jgi:hypothetical protein
MRVTFNPQTGRVSVLTLVWSNGKPTTWARVRRYG